MRLFHNLFKKYCFCIGSGYESYDDTDDETETTWFVYDALVKDIRASSVPKRLIIRYMLWAGATEEEAYDKERVAGYLQEMMDYPGMYSCSYQLFKDYPSWMI